MRARSILRNTRRITVVGLLVGVGTAAFLTLIFLASPLWLKLTPSLHLDPPRGGETVILAEDGTEIGRVSSDTQLELIGDIKVPNVIKTVILSSEDRRFNSHNGVDVKGTARALVSNLQGSAVQGGSTITQQLVRNQTTIGTQRTLSRKLIEAAFALRLEAQRDKEWILHRYLDTVWLGNGMRGVETASNGWFGVSTSELSIAQAASIAAALPCPESCNPVDHPAKNEERRQRVLDGLLEQGKFSATQIEAARAPITVTFTPAERSASGDAWVLDTVRRELLAQGVEGFEGSRWPGGLTIRTNISKTAQQAAIDAVANVMGQPGISSIGLQAAVAVVEPGTGNLRAVVGGRDFDQSQVNIALGKRGGGSGRQGGSTAKTFAVIAALETGLDGDHEVAAPMQVSIGGTPVTNSDWRSWGSITIATAAKHSVNTAFINLATEIGPDRVADVATRLGVPTPRTVDERVVLGLVETDPVAMAGAYAAIAAKGYWVEPHAVQSVLRDGESLYSAKPRARQAISEQVAADTVQILRNVIRYGTGYRANLVLQGRSVDAFGKTGTTNSSADTWFTGSNSMLAAAVWIGNPAGSIRTRPVSGFETASGGAAPAKIWHDLMISSLTSPVPALWSPERTFTTKYRPLPAKTEQPSTDPVTSDAANEQTTSPSAEPSSEPVTPPTTEPTLPAPSTTPASDAAPKSN